MGVKAATRAISCIPVKEAMQRTVITIREDQTVHELATLLKEKDISGVPVVDEHGSLVGVATTKDIAHREAERHVEIPSYYFDRAPEGFQVEAVDLTRVKDIMTPVVISVPPDTSLGHVARLLLEKHIHRVIVASKSKREHRIEGIVTVGDILRLIAE